MKFIFVLISSILLFSTNITAGEIFRCEVNGQVRYVQSKVHCENSQARPIKISIEKHIANKHYSDTELKKSEAWLKDYEADKLKSEQKNKLYQETHANWLKIDKQAKTAQQKADQHQEEWSSCNRMNARLLKKNQKSCRLKPKLQQQADYLKAEAEGHEKNLAKF